MFRFFKSKRPQTAPEPETLASASHGSGEAAVNRLAQDDTWERPLSEAEQLTRSVMMAGAHP